MVYWNGSYKFKVFWWVIQDFTKNLNASSTVNNITALITAYLAYLSIVAIIVLVQDSYKRVKIVSARQLNFNYLEQSSSNSKLTEPVVGITGVKAKPGVPSQTYWPNAPTPYPQTTSAGFLI